ncbi:MAG: hypothetical protein HY850_06850 [Betaproteobacteria bacterium]|nr:hypothetical protein [Betaproteobacteria bacterium]
MKHLKMLFLLLAAFVVIFTGLNGWKDGQGPGDDPAYVQSAYDYWHKGAHPGAITWSPGYVALMSPVVGILGKETGYKVWRFAVLFGVSMLIYVAFQRMFGSAWVGFVMALYSQMLMQPYASPSLQALLGLLYLACLVLLVGKERYLGFVFAILLNSVFVSGAAATVLFAFGVFCLIFYPRWLFSLRFFAQFAVGVALFTVVLQHFEYDISKYPTATAQRGRAGLYHQLSLYILASGRSTPYLLPGEDDPKLHPVDEYHRHLNAIERYYLDKFGQTEGELRDKSQDARWPAVLLDWPWLIEKDPELMRGYAREVVRTLVEDSALTAFEAVRPYDRGPSWKRLLRNLVVMATVVAITLLPLLRLRDGKPKLLERVSLPSRLQALFALSCFSTLIPLILVKPLPIYFPPLIPVYLLILAVVSVVIAKALGRLPKRPMQLRRKVIGDEVDV